jgi:hypothetical protein
MVAFKVEFDGKARVVFKVAESPRLKVDPLAGLVSYFVTTAAFAKVGVNRLAIKTSRLSPAIFFVNVPSF